MKHCSTLVFFLLCLTGYAQEPFFQPLAQWDAPEISEKQLHNAKISSIQVRIFEQANARSRLVPTIQQVSLLRKDGSPLEIVQTSQKGGDTAQIITYHYNGNGTLWRKEVDDRIGNRTFRSGYRCTRNQEFYQVRSYEMLNEEERMLLSSRQYLYRDGKLEAIQLRENDRIIRVHRFSYNEKGAVTEERLEDADESVLKSVSYSYGANNLITEVRTQESHGTVSRYRYAYNDQGLPKQVEWFEGDSEEAKGLALYEYDQRGLLIAFNRIMYPRTARQKSTIKRYSYETFLEEKAPAEGSSEGMIATQ